MNKTHLYATLLLLSCGAALLAAAQAVNAPSAPWRSLLQDDSAPDWRGSKEPGLPAGWRVAGGMLSKEGPVDDLVTNESFGSFELELEGKISRAGNSGIFYRGTREYDHIYWSAPEYQLLDDANAADGGSRLTAAAAAYALYGAPAGVVLPFDHWLNGHRVVEYELKSADWKSRVAASKFAAYPNYGLATTGVIGLQGDHPGVLAIRHIHIRELL
jgi:hypothetical protein